MPPLTELSEWQKAELADALSTSALGKVADFSGKRQAVV
jgi:hypothetical protein